MVITKQFSGASTSSHNNMTIMSMHQDTRTHVVGEIYDTERSYVESLQILVDKYMKPLKSQESQRALIDSQLVDEIFYTIPEILKHHETFLSALQDRLSSDWDSSQVIGNVFIEAFTNQQIIDTYTAFINNWKQARQALKMATQAKPAFERYLEAMSRGHRNKLTLDALLIMPVQRIPRYELLIKELIKHTPEEHPDYGPLMVAQQEIHQLALKIDRAEREMMHQEQLRELESLIDGHVELQHPQRDFIRYDLVTIQGAAASAATGSNGTSSLTSHQHHQAGNHHHHHHHHSTAATAKKERVLFLFCDLLIMTSVKKKASRRTNLHAALAESSNDLTLLEGNKFKLLLRVALDQIEIRLSPDQVQVQLRQQEHEQQIELQRQARLMRDRRRELEADLGVLHQMEALSAKLGADEQERALVASAINESISRIRERLFNLAKQTDLLETRANHSAALQQQADLYHPIQSSCSSASGGAAAAGNSPQTTATLTNSVGQQQQQLELTASTSLEFIISSFAAAKDSASANLSASESQSGANEQTAMMSESQSAASQLHLNQSQESLVVTFATLDRLQAFLRAFVEAKQLRHQKQRQLQLQHQQQQRMYSTSAVLRLSQPGTPEHGGKRQQAALGTCHDSAARAAGRVCASVPSGQHHQHHSAGAANTGAAPIVHQMSAPQSLALGQSSQYLAECKTKSPSECTSCASNLASSKPITCELEHRHQLTHQPKSQPASLDTYCFYSHHQQHRAPLELAGAADFRVDGRYVPISEKQPQQQQQLDNSQLASVSSPQLLLIKSAPKFLLTLPMRFLNTQHPALQFTCSTLRNPAAAAATDNNRVINLSSPPSSTSSSTSLLHPQANKLKSQTVRDCATGQLWLCMSNGYVSHIALILLKRTQLAGKSADGDSNTAPGEHATDCFAKANRVGGCYNIEPIIQSAGDICKSHINCVSQVSWIRGKRKRKPLESAELQPEVGAAVSGETANSGGESQADGSNAIQRIAPPPPPIELEVKATSPPVDINLSAAYNHAASGAGADADDDDDGGAGRRNSERFLSESAPAHSQSQSSIGGPGSAASNSKYSIGTTTSAGSASTTRLEVPSPRAASACQAAARANRLQNLRDLNLGHRSVDTATGDNQARRRLAQGIVCQRHHNHHHHHHHHQHHQFHQHQQHSHLHPKVGHLAATKHRQCAAAANQPSMNPSQQHHHLAHQHLHGHTHHHHNHPHSHNHHHMYGTRHNTVPLGELRRALERQNRLLDERQIADGLRNYQQQQQAARADRLNNGAPPMSPSDQAVAIAAAAVAARRRVSRSHQQISSLDRQDTTATSGANCRLDLKVRATTPPAGGITASSGGNSAGGGGIFGSANKSFRSARSLRHQASLKTSSILAKLVSSAGKRSSYLRKAATGSPTPGEKAQVDQQRGGKSKRILSDLELNKEPNTDDDCNSDTDNEQQTLARHQVMAATRVKTPDPVDDILANVTTPGSVKCHHLDTSQSDLNNQVIISPLSSVSSLASTNSSMTVNSVCVSSPNHSSCDLLAHSLSSSCCVAGGNPLLGSPVQYRALKSADGCNLPQSSECRMGECPFRSRSATMPSQELQHQRPSLALADLQASGQPLMTATQCQYQPLPAQAPGCGATSSYRVSEIVAEQAATDQAAAAARQVDETNDEPEARVQSSLWLGCDDGSLLVIDCLANNCGQAESGAATDQCNLCTNQVPTAISECNNQHSEVKLGAAICDIRPYKDHTVFVALANGQLVIISRNEEDDDDHTGGWQLASPRILTITAATTSESLESVASKLCLVNDTHVWYAFGRNVFVLNIETLELEATVVVPAGGGGEISASLQQFALQQTICVENMEHMQSLSCVWVSLKNSHMIQLYDGRRYNLLLELNVFDPIYTMLSYGQHEIIRQHKSACIKISAMLSVQNIRESCSTLFIGTSAGIILYLNITEQQLTRQRDPAAASPKDEWRPQIASLRHGHSGNVKFLHLIDLSTDHGVGSKLPSDQQQADNKTATPGKEMFLISGGSGVDLYGPSAADEQQQQQQQVAPLKLDSEEDNLNHLIFWQL